MRISAKHVVSAAIALVIGLSANVQAQSATMPTATITFPTVARVTFGSPDVPLQITQSAGVTTAESITPTTCSVINNSSGKGLLSSSIIVST